MKKYGCLYCESPGTTLNGDHLHRYWPYDEASACRSHASVMHNAELATRTRSCVSESGIVDAGTIVYACLSDLCSE